MSDYNIKPLIVEIKTLKIGKKQCTIAVFKQIKEKIFQIEEDIDIWGEVKFKNDWFVVYGKNGTLYKVKKSIYDFKEVDNNINPYSYRYSPREVLEYVGDNNSSVLTEFIQRFRLYHSSSIRQEDFHFKKIKYLFSHFFLHRPEYLKGIDIKTFATNFKEYYEELTINLEKERIEKEKIKYEFRVKLDNIPHLFIAI